MMTNRLMSHGTSDQVRGMEGGGRAHNWPYHVDTHSFPHRKTCGKSPIKTRSDLSSIFLNNHATPYSIGYYRPQQLPL